jgi:hypothetical protein
MPVTRDLGSEDRRTILKWLATKGPDGLPPLGSPRVAPASAKPATARPDDNLDPLQKAGKTAVILKFEKTSRKEET